MKMKALCYEKLNNENRIKLSVLVLEMLTVEIVKYNHMRVCLSCLINIHEVSYDVIVAH